MLRVIAGVIVGYAVSVVLALVGIIVAWAIFGFEGAFAENSTVASTPWSITVCAFGFVAGVAAGATAATIGRHPEQLAVKVLAGLILLLGLGIAVMSMGNEPQPVPAEWADGGVGFLEAGAAASNPPWYDFVIPIVGAVGVLVGGNLVGRPVSAPR
jgi:hypothetical protein